MQHTQFVWAPPVEPGDNFGVDLFGEAGGRMIEGAADCAREAFEFTQGRLAADLEFMQAASACKTPAELISCQFAFTEAAARQYGAEATKMAAHFARMFGAPRSS